MPSRAAAACLREREDGVFLLLWNAIRVAGEPLSGTRAGREPGPVPEGCGTPSAKARFCAQVEGTAHGRQGVACKTSCQVRSLQGDQTRAPVDRPGQSGVCHSCSGAGTHLLGQAEVHVTWGAATLTWSRVPAFRHWARGLRSFCQNLDRPGPQG